MSEHITGMDCEQISNTHSSTYFGILICVVFKGVSNRWNGIWNGTVEWKMEWNGECTYNLASFPGSSAPERDIEVVHAERAWYLFLASFPGRSRLQF